MRLTVLNAARAPQVLASDLQIDPALEVFKIKPPSTDNAEFLSGVRFRTKANPHNDNGVEHSQNGNGSANFHNGNGHKSAEEMVVSLGIPVVKTAPAGWDWVNNPVSLSNESVLRSMASSMRTCQSVVTIDEFGATFWRPKTGYEQLRSQCVCGAEKWFSEQGQ